MNVKLTDNQRKEIGNYLELDIETLYENLCDEYAAHVVRGRKIKGFLALNTRKKEQGRHLFHDFIIPEIQPYLCDEWELCTKIKDVALADTSEFVSEVAEMINDSKLPFPFSVFLIATMIVKTDSRSLCGCTK